MGLMQRLFKGGGPANRACACGQPAQARVAEGCLSEPETLEARCLGCLDAVVKPSLAERTTGCLVVQPYRDAPCLIPHLQEDLAPLASWSSRVRDLLSAATRRCMYCGSPTPGLVWVQTDAAQSLPTMQRDARWFVDRQGTSLCAGCLTSQLVRTMGERGLHIERLVLPADAPSIWLPWTEAPLARTASAATKAVPDLSFDASIPVWDGPPADANYFLPDLPATPPVKRVAVAGRGHHRSDF